MPILLNKKKLAALNKNKCEEHLRSSLARNSIVPRSQGDYITQVSVKIERRVTKKLSQEFSWTENRILGALSPLNCFLMKPPNQGHSGTAGRRPGKHISRTREGMKTTPRVILILNQTSFTIRWRYILAQKMATKLWQQFTRRSHTAPLVKHQKSRNRTSLPVNRNSAVTILLQRLKQTKPCWPFSSWQTTIILQVSRTISAELSNCQNRSQL